MKVLLVDDDPAILEVLRAYLQGAGFSVLEAQDGEEALLLFPQADLVVLDLMLPKMDGWRVAEAIKRERPELSILMLTARGEEEERVRGLDQSSPMAPCASFPGSGRLTWEGSPCPSPGWSLTFSSPWPSTRAWCSAGKGFWKRSGGRTFPGWTGWRTCTSPGFGKSSATIQITPAS